MIDRRDPGNPPLCKQQVSRLDVIETYRAASAGPAQELDEKALRPNDRRVMPQGAATKARLAHGREETDRPDGVDETRIGKCSTEERWVGREGVSTGRSRE